MSEGCIRCDDKPTRDKRTRRWWWLWHRIREILSEIKEFRKEMGIVTAYIARIEAKAEKENTLLPNRANTTFCEWCGDTDHNEEDCAA